MQGLVCTLTFLLLLTAGNAIAAIEAPKVVNVVLADRQPFADDPAVIWYDDFDEDRLAHYLEPRDADSPHAARSEAHHLGERGASMRCHYPAGEHGFGGRKLVFGDAPIGDPLHPERSFDDVYWRIYVKHQRGWQGAGPEKMSRATGIVDRHWAQAFILHVWGGGEQLTLDPVSCVRGDTVMSSKYNDWDHMQWLGNSPAGATSFQNGAAAGRWICVEARLKLNTPGKRDGYAALWVDGRLDTERRNMDFRGSYTEHQINAIFLESYWNEGAPVAQDRYYDDFVVSTEPIGPLVADAVPTLICGPRTGSWQLQIGSGADDEQAVWSSDEVDADTARIAPDRALDPGSYVCRTRARDSNGAWSAWSAWHQPFRVLD